jgi:hypothetical protein
VFVSMIDGRKEERKKKKKKKQLKRENETIQCQKVTKVAGTEVQSRRGKTQSSPHPQKA